MSEHQHQDSTGRELCIGDRVRYRSQILTVKGFLPGPPGTLYNFVVFEEAHELALETAVDLVQARREEW